jgi:hypothetical protein
MELGLKPRTHVHWAAPVVFEQLERSWLGRNGRFLSMITERNYHHESGYGGWYTWDTLLTGVRVAVFAALGQPSALHLFGKGMSEALCKRFPLGVVFSFCFASSAR